MTVGRPGSVCNACFDETMYKDLLEDTTLCDLMEKLSFPCNYTAEGCTFFGSFRKTCEHEQSCFFRGRLCPFVYMNKCDNKEYIHDIVSHVQEQHKNNIVEYVDLGIRIKNPNFEQPDELYFSNIMGNFFLIRTFFSCLSKESFFMFYRMNDNHIAKKVIFHALPLNQGQMENIGVISDFELSKFDLRNAISLDRRMPKSTKEFKIYVRRKICKYQHVNTLFTPSVWAQCSQCSSSVQEIYMPSQVQIPLKYYCEHCSAKNTKYSGKQVKVDVSELKVSYLRRCSNKACRQLILSDNSYAHLKYQCNAIEYACPISGCLADSGIPYIHPPEYMSEHFLEKHKNYVNPKTCSLIQRFATYIYFNDSDVFLQECEIYEDVFYTRVIKLTAPYLDNSHYWEVHIESKVNTMAIIIIGGYVAQAIKREVHVGGYLDCGKLEFRTYITCV
ncbi:Seven in absentia protein family [Popillia japonica]|uniref:Seven in absentia protein family n=1 Tax=Popillia japonica TaxID=7064 RepID=A0AAW1HF69_POPJA